MGSRATAATFDYLAARLAADCRVVCIDVPGRGASEWLADKLRLRLRPLSVGCGDAARACARASRRDAARPRTRAAARRPAEPRRLGRHVDGRTDRDDDGGQTRLADRPPGAERHRPARAVVGPRAAEERARRTEREVQDLPELEQHLRVACAPFGPLDDAKWRHVTRHSARRNEDGTWSLAYDPGIVSALRRGNNSGLEFGGDFLLGVDLWPVWETISVRRSCCAARSPTCCSSRPPSRWPSADRRRA